MPASKRNRQMRELAAMIHMLLWADEHEQPLTDGQRARARTGMGWLQREELGLNRRQRRCQQAVWRQRQQVRSK